MDVAGGKRSWIGHDGGARAPDAQQVTPAGSQGGAAGPSHPVEVVGRIRELPEGKKGPLAVTLKDDHMVEVRAPDQSARQYTLDGVSFAAEESQGEFYNRFVQARVEDVKAGGHCLIMMYGPTGTGKSHMMFTPEVGIAYKALKQLMNEAEKPWTIGEDPDAPETNPPNQPRRVTAAVLEIYKEEVFDLLAGFDPEAGQSTPSKKGVGQKAKVMVMAGKAVNATEISSSDPRVLLKDIKRVHSIRRVTKSTKQNARSSRSHCLVILEIPAVGGRLILADLAGSESGEHSDTREAQLEMGTINRSNSALKNVIDAIADGSSHVPYRNSQLTYLLRDSFEGDGNTRILMVLCASPAIDSAKETQHTLEYGAKAKCIVRLPHTPPKNKDAGGRSEMLLLEAKLRAKDEMIEKLRKDRGRGTVDRKGGNDSEVHVLVLRVEELERENGALKRKLEEMEDEREAFEKKMRMRIEQTTRQKMEGLELRRRVQELEHDRETLLTRVEAAEGEKGRKGGLIKKMFRWSGKGKGDSPASGSPGGLNSSLDLGQMGGGELVRTSLDENEENSLDEVEDLSQWVRKAGLVQTPAGEDEYADGEQDDYGSARKNRDRSNGLPMITEEGESDLELSRSWQGKKFQEAIAEAKKHLDAKDTETLKPIEERGDNASESMEVTSEDAGQGSAGSSGISVCSDEENLPDSAEEFPSDKENDQDEALSRSGQRGSGWTGALQNEEKSNKKNTEQSGWLHRPASAMAHAEGEAHTAVELGSNAMSAVNGAKPSADNVDTVGEMANLTVGGSAEEDGKVKERKVARILDFDSEQAVKGVGVDLPPRLGLLQRINSLREQGLETGSSSPQKIGREQDVSRGGLSSASERQRGTGIARELLDKDLPIGNRISTGGTFDTGRDESITLGKSPGKGAVLTAAEAWSMVPYGTSAKAESTSTLNAEKRESMAETPKRPVVDWSTSLGSPAAKGAPAWKAIPLATGHVDWSPSKKSGSPLESSPTTAPALNRVGSSGRRESPIGTHPQRKSMSPNGEWSVVPYMGIESSPKPHTDFGSAENVDGAKQSSAEKGSGSGHSPIATRRWRAMESIFISISAARKMLTKKSTPPPPSGSHQTPVTAAGPFSSMASDGATPADIGAGPLPGGAEPVIGGTPRTPSAQKKGFSFRRSIEKSFRRSTEGLFGHRAPSSGGRAGRTPPTVSTQQPTPTSRNRFGWPGASTTPSPLPMLALPAPNQFTPTPHANSPHRLTRAASPSSEATAGSIAPASAAGMAPGGELPSGPDASSYASAWLDRSTATNHDLPLSPKLAIHAAQRARSQSATSSPARAGVPTSRFGSVGNAQELSDLSPPESTTKSRLATLFGKDTPKADGNFSPASNPVTPAGSNRFGWKGSQTESPIVIASPPTATTPDCSNQFSSPSNMFGSTSNIGSGQAVGNPTHEVEFTSVYVKFESTSSMVAVFSVARDTTLADLRQMIQAKLNDKRQSFLFLRLAEVAGSPIERSMEASMKVDYLPENPIAPGSRFACLRPAPLQPQTFSSFADRAAKPFRPVENQLQSPGQKQLTPSKSAIPFRGGFRSGEDDWGMSLREKAQLQRQLSENGRGGEVPKIAVKTSIPGLRAGSGGEHRRGVSWSETQKSNHARETASPYL